MKDMNLTNAIIFKLSTDDVTTYSYIPPTWKEYIQRSTHRTAAFTTHGPSVMAGISLKRMFLKSWGGKVPGSEGSGQLMSLGTLPLQRKEHYVSIYIHANDIFLIIFMLGSAEILFMTECYKIRIIN